MASSSAQQLIAAILSALKDTSAPKAWLVTVIETWGSSPRPAGSMMFWSGLTGVVGSISGGCIEEDVLQKIRADELPSDRPSQLSYGGKGDQRFKLPCGGKLTVLVEPLSGGEEAITAWEACLRALNSRQGIARFVDVTHGHWRWQGSASFDLHYENNVVSYFAGPARKLLIVGANPTAYHLAEFASALDFAVTVCDPSSDVGQYWFEANFCAFKPAYPDGFVAQDFGDAQSAVVTVSHDPRIDDMALLEALPSKAFYVGAMGSLATSHKRLQRLQSLGLSVQSLQRLHAPIGIDIGSKTPSEIAMSIAAHLVQCYSAQRVSAMAASKVAPGVAL
ncbi:XdhC family protein [Marinagarivorans cellulosilyticus]|nr:XdhC family protein [Marinagarivorans cellulosilyticus]